MAAGPVSRILSALRRDGHSSGPRITAGLKRPTRRFGAPSRHASRRFRRSLPSYGNLPNRRELPPYLVLLRVGFALPAALLQRRCALTAPFHPYPAVLANPRLIREGLTRTSGRYVFCGTFRRPGLNPASRTLSGTLLCGVRTFLYHPRRMTATVRSSCQQLHYIRFGFRTQALG